MPNKALQRTRRSRAAEQKERFKNSAEFKKLLKNMLSEIIDLFTNHSFSSGALKGHAR